MVLSEKHLLACSEKDFKKLYLESLDASSDAFNRCEKIRCKRHANIYSIIRAQKKPTICSELITKKQNNRNKTVE